MHLEIRQDRPGDYPICGMALEVVVPSAEASNPELAAISRRFRPGAHSARGRARRSSCAAGDRCAGATSTCPA